MTKLVLKTDDQQNIFILKSDGPLEPEQRMVFAEVYAPNRPDSDGEYMTAESIRKMAHQFARDNRFAQVDVQHNNTLTRGVQVVESFIAQKGDPTFLEGAWVVGVHIPDDELWSQVQKGEINGFSMEALVQRDSREVELFIPPVVSGTTSTPSSVTGAAVKGDTHEHHFFVTYSPEGVFMGGLTDEVQGHKHTIRGGTITDVTNGHIHKFSSVDDINIA
jgi:hypothetical protein